MNKRRLAFVDYWHHEFTRSGDFLREIFKDDFHIENFWWKPKEKFPIDSLKKFDYIFFFHVMFPYQVMKVFKEKKILWAPMYDGLIFKNQFERKIFWRQISLLNIKILEFSKQVSESINNENIDILKLRYYIKPDTDTSNKSTDSKLNIFFWDRGQIKIKDWIDLFNPKDINEIIYFPLVDPSRKITENLNLYQNINFKIVKKDFLPKAEYLDLMKNCNVFIAPRIKEGIGMSIVEALSKNKFIVGYNDSTMNEYIANEKIGYLFETNSKKININNIFNEKNYRAIHAKEKYEEWLIQKEEIIPFFEKENLDNNEKITDMFLIFDNIKYLIKKILKKNRFIS